MTQTSFRWTPGQAGFSCGGCQLDQCQLACSARPAAKWHETRAHRFNLPAAGRLQDSGRRRSCQARASCHPERFQQSLRAHLARPGAPYDHRQPCSATFELLQRSQHPLVRRARCRLKGRVACFLRWIQTLQRNKHCKYLERRSCHRSDIMSKGGRLCGPARPERASVWPGDRSVAKVHVTWNVRAERRARGQDAGSAGTLSAAVAVETALCTR